MRFCPFAERALLTIALKDIPYVCMYASVNACAHRCEVVNIHLRQKPDWFTARNPTGTVPTLERDNIVIYESPVAIEWLDAIYPSVGGAPIVPADPTVRAQQKMLVERLSGVSGCQRR
jgi:glutathione S-transferase